MANSNPPGQRPPHLRDDEPIALLVAFLAFGAIGFWSYSEYQNGRFNFALVQPTSSPASVAKATISSKPILPSLPQTHPVNAEPAAETLTPKTLTPKTNHNNLQSRISVQPQNPTVSVPLPEVVSPAIPGGETPSVNPSNVSAPVAKTPGFFTDVPTTHWAYASIKALDDLKLAEGFPDNTYHPDQPITRSGFAAMVEKAFEKPEQPTTKTFKDVKAGNQQSQVVTKAVKSNFMTGYPDSTFKPDQTISRTEAIAAMVKGLGLQPPANPDTVLKRFGDNKAIPKWARPKIAAAVASGLLANQHNDNQLLPRELATRADVAALVVKGLEVVKK